MHQDVTNDSWGVGVLPLHQRLTLSSISFIIAAPNRPILTASCIYGSSGRLLEIESQATAGVGYGGQGKAHKFIMNTITLCASPSCIYNYVGKQC